MKDGIGEGFTRADHQDVANQLFSCYAKVGDARALASVIGEDELSPLDKQYLVFGKAFEAEFVGQSETETEASLKLWIKAGNFWDFSQEKNSTVSIPKFWISITEKPSVSEVILWIRIPFPPREISYLQKKFSGPFQTGL